MDRQTSQATLTLADFRFTHIARGIYIILVIYEAHVQVYIIHID